MSGPIIRKYGFANFDKIFGEKPIPHGQDEPASSPDSASLPPDLPKDGKLDDPTKPESAGTMVPSTEFGSAVE
ncbi:MAG: hypothetical protein JWN86_2177 [Planctomycetota bacterium]|nr:hypothetical protein [Planctomycetota bacterium]